MTFLRDFAWSILPILGLPIGICIGLVIKALTG